MILSCIDNPKAFNHGYSGTSGHMARAGSHGETPIHQMKPRPSYFLWLWSAEAHINWLFAASWQKLYVLKFQIQWQTHTFNCRHNRPVSSPWSQQRNKKLKHIWKILITTARIISLEICLKKCDSLLVETLFKCWKIVSNIPGESTFKTYRMNYWYRIYNICTSTSSSRRMLADWILDLQTLVPVP